MRRILPLVLLLLLLVAPLRAEIPPALQPKVENHLLKVSNLQLRLELIKKQQEEEMARLREERGALEAELRKALNPPSTHVFNWEKLEFVAPPAEPK